MRVHAAGKAIVGHAVEAVEQLLAGEDLAGVLGQHGQERELAGREVDGPALARDVVAGQIDFQVAGAYKARPADLALSAPARRSTARTLATSSRGEKGLVT